MKTLMVFIFLILTATLLQAQTAIAMSKGVCSDTLKSGKTSFIITPDVSINSKFTIVLKTISGTDTVYVATNSRNNVYSTSKLVIDLSTGSPVNPIIVTTTAKEYFVYDPQVFKLTLTTLHGLVSTLFTVSRK